MTLAPSSPAPRASARPRAGRALLLALAEPKVDPTKEFLLHPYVEIKPFPWLDLSITKAVLYLMFAAVDRGRRADPGHPRRPAPEARSGSQTVVELVYDFTETSIGRASLPEKVFTTWFPYLAALFVFIWVSNLISYIPLPFDTEHKWHGIPGFTLYAATANLSVTLALTLVTFFASHYVGIKYQRRGHYFKHWVPPAPKAMRPFIAVLEVLSQLLRLVSLSVRLFANMFAGHLLVLMSPRW